MISLREVEALELVAAALANKEEIAARLGLTEETVKSHMRNIMEELKANDRAHAVIIAVRRGVIPI